MRLKTKNTFPHSEFRVCEWVLVVLSCPTLCDPMNCGLSGSSVYEILEVRILEWVAISFFRESSQLRNQTWVSCIAGRFFTIWATRETPRMTCPATNWKVSWLIFWLVLNQPVWLIIVTKMNYFSKVSLRRLSKSWDLESPRVAVWLMTVTDMGSAFIMHRDAWWSLVSNQCWLKPGKKLIRQF